MKRTKSQDTIQSQTNIEGEKSIIRDTYALSNKSDSDKTDDTITNTKKKTKTHNDKNDDVNITENTIDNNLQSQQNKPFSKRRIRKFPSFPRKLKVRVT
jgi:hypothetical protein